MWDSNSRYHAARNTNVRAQQWRGKEKRERLVIVEEGDWGVENPGASLT